MTTCAIGPVDIGQATTLPTCALNCAYTYKYGLQDLIVSNRSNRLDITSQQTPIAGATMYNGRSYTLLQAMLIRPSLHTFNGTKASAELLLLHVSQISGKYLFVSIPITAKANSPSDASRLFDAIMVNVKQQANAVGQIATFTLPAFSFDKFIPSSPASYYSYTANMLGQPCALDTPCDYVVFSTEKDGGLSMSLDAFAVLKKVTKEMTDITVNASASTKPTVYYNKGGAKPIAAASDDIFIDCQPTGSDGLVVVENNPSTAQMFDTSAVTDLLQNGLFQVIVGVILMLAIMKVGKILLKKVASDAK